MENLTLNCSESTKEFIQEEIASGAFSNPTDVVEKLVHDEKKRRAREKVEALLDKAIASGEPSEVTDQDWQDIRKEIARRDAAYKAMSQDEERESEATDWVDGTMRDVADETSRLGG